MTPEQIKEQVFRMEGFADGIKQGSVIFAKWVVEELQREAQKKGDPDGKPSV